MSKTAINSGLSDIYPYFPEGINCRGIALCLKLSSAESKELFSMTSVPKATIIED